jgi:general secretion pathway protein I
MRCRARGFTLIEILIALTVLAVAMGAIIKAASDYTGSIVHLRERTLANWVARDVLNDFQVRKEWPRVGERKGTLAMGRNEWAWRAVISQTDEAELRRMDVEVVPEESDPDAEPVTRLSGFLRQPGS